MVLEETVMIKGFTQVEIKTENNKWNRFLGSFNLICIALMSLHTPASERSQSERVLRCSNKFIIQQ
jgi:hypothetical protein